MENFLTAFIFVVMFLVWVAFSVVAIAYWTKTPKDVMEKIAVRDSTKKWLFWYGYLFSIFIASSVFISFTIVLAWLLVNGKF